MSNRGFVKPYISIGLSSQICRFVLEYSNIWQRCGSINIRFSTKQEEKCGRWRWLLWYYSTSIWEEWGCTGWTWTIFESATTGFVDSGSVVIWKAWTDMCRLRDRRNRLSTESVESVECLHNRLLSGLIDGVLTQMDVSALDEWARKADFQELITWECKNADFICAFDDFVDLSIVVFYIAISNIKKRWSTIDFDEFWSEIIN